MALSNFLCSSSPIFRKSGLGSGQFFRPFFTGVGKHKAHQAAALRVELEPEEPQAYIAAFSPASSSPQLSSKSLPTIPEPTNPDQQGNWFIVEQVLMGTLSPHRLESVVSDPVRSIELRRACMQALNSPVPPALPVHGTSFDSTSFFNNVAGVNCESVIGFMPIPVGVVGPLLLDGRIIHVPMATTEGALIASANRGARALSMSGGVTSVLTRDAMSRAPVIKVASLIQAAELKKFVESPQGLSEMQRIFSTTSRFGRITSITATIAGRNVFVRFCCSTGDAMGMNMVTKGINSVVEELLKMFEGSEMITLSGNLCMDKKPSAINWIEGRGKSVSAEAVIPESIVKEVLKTEIDRIVEVNKTKVCATHSALKLGVFFLVFFFARNFLTLAIIFKQNLIGSSLAGSIGGNNAHAANLVAAIFIATGQDPAQVVESCTCMTTMDKITHNDRPALLMTVNMPSIEVGTVGGGTALGPQSACLEMLGVKGAGVIPGENSQRLARVVCAGVMAGELSLLAALSANHLVSAHMALNRKPQAPSN
jgi:hydroxymethylglutaryl-CoA reductase (NADPH)